MDSKYISNNKNKFVKFQVVDKVFKVSLKCLIPLLSCSSVVLINYY